ncbi:MAG: C39 family peptidase [Patescibacteria group bacterium]|nr:C39 family peptidase [Patescibacteria group bacterium]
MSSFSTYIKILISLVVVVFLVYILAEHQRISILNQTLLYSAKEDNTLPISPTSTASVPVETPTKGEPAPATKPIPPDPFMATLKKEVPPDLSLFNVVSLNVPILKQSYARSCEEASLRMVLAYYNIEATDMDIVKQVGYDPVAFDADNGIWGDPNEMFVGFIDDTTKSGYGTFAPPIAKAAISFGRTAKAYLGVSATFLASEIYEKHPVIVWGFFNPGSPIIKYSWKTEAGKKIVAYRGEHVRVITSVVGDKDNPVGFFLNDPLTGESVYWSTKRLMTHMNMLGNLTNQAVVVE